jgi:hypothetical protein
MWHVTQCSVLTGQVESFPGWELCVPSMGEFVALAE